MVIENGWEICLISLLCSQLMTDTEFNNLISKFPMLENVWIVSCDELQRIKIPRLKTTNSRDCMLLDVLDFLRKCSRFEAVKFDSSNSFETLYNVGAKVLDISLSDPSHRCPTINTTSKLFI